MSDHLTSTDGVLHSVGVLKSPEEILNYCSYKKLLLDVVTDDSDTIVQLNALIDIYFDTPSGQNAVKLGTVRVFGNLVPATSQYEKPKWNATYTVSSYFKEKDAGKLPPLVCNYGPGAIITCLTQTLFGTKAGKTLLGLQDYNMPDTDAGETKIINTFN